MIQKDKLYHLAGGAAALIVCLALILVSRHIGAPATTVLGGLALGIGLEGYQWVRNEGQVEALDAAYTAAPWVAAAAVMHFMGVT